MLGWMTTMVRPASPRSQVNIRHDVREDLATLVLQPGMAVPVDEFLDWVEREEGKYEYDRGTVGMMVKVTQNHAALCARFLFLLTQQADPDLHQVFAEAFAVRVGRSVRFPDVLMQAAGDNGKSLESANPLVIVEIVSPSSFYLDTVVKRDEYLALPSLQAYIVASQDSASADIWLRQPDGHFPEKPEELVGLEAAIEIPSLGVKLPLGDLYRHLKD